MARPKETEEVKVKKVYPDAECITQDWSDMHDLSPCILYGVVGNGQSLSWAKNSELEAWSDALSQIRKAKIKAAKDKRKQAQPVKVKEIKKHTMCTMYPTDKAIIVKGFGSVQKFLDSKVNEYKLTIKTK